MTIVKQQLSHERQFYSIQKTEHRGRAAFALKDIPAGITIYTALNPYIYNINECFKKEVCAWCFKYQDGKNWPLKHPNINVGLHFCSGECLQRWIDDDVDGKLAQVWTALRSNKAKKVDSL